MARGDEATLEHIGDGSRRGPDRGDPIILESLLRELTPQVIAILVRRFGQFDAVEDAVQEALIAATAEWPLTGLPNSPRSWLVTVASRRLVDEWRRDSARRRREEFSASVDVRIEVPTSDDSLTLLFLCCHPALSAPAQIALSLRAVGGLTTEEIARALLVPTATMGQRISRSSSRSLRPSCRSKCLRPRTTRHVRRPSFTCCT